MKRRNVELAKMRRPMKRSKITEGFYGSTLLYLKFLILWMLVILADFILEFRFEFLWPFYLLIRSVYDSFKYQGLAFSIFFVLIALTSDMLCFFFIPVHWLFFAASTYVWVQFVWHTDKGICAPTIVLWILFVYLEAAIRLRDVKHMPGHLDLCRPFAAHCIGYPVVTLGFGFKSYVGYRMRQRKQQHVAKENQFYMQLMQQALPADTQPAEVAETTATASASTPPTVQNNNKLPNSGHLSNSGNSSKQERNGHVANGSAPSSLTNGLPHRTHKRRDHDDVPKQKSNQHSNGSIVAAEGSTTTDDAAESESKPTHSISKILHCATRRREKREPDREHEYLQRLELESKRLRTELQQSRASEQELRIQVAALTTSEKGTRGELIQLQRQLDDVHERLQSATASKCSDKQSIGALERRVNEERRLRTSLESQLNQERKIRKQEEARLIAAQQQQQQMARAADCTDACKSRRRDLEAELADCRQTQRWAEERCKGLELENRELAEQLRDRERLRSAVAALQEKNADLENSLSAETRIKLDLFSALGDAKRQLEIRDSVTRAQEKEIEELKGKIAQVLAVMPNDTFGAASAGGGATVSRVCLADSPQSKLDPNATAYTPKGSLIASTEA
ncbi:macoilin-1 isoform X2 [Cylas formicarius]|uniref:macoilin-1 isoform X2 n=1 Tax=Cylas formicarius TaxID=197179 RepID=UPI0029588285|nr:macoilin-1 isoform X2 [Cylas formicarius]